MKQKLLFFTSRLPLEPKSGREISLYYYIKYLFYMYNFEIIIISFSDKKEIDNSSEFISRLYTVPNPKKIDIFKNLINKTLIKGMPLQVSLFYSRNIQDRVLEIIDKEQPDIIMADMVRTSEYLKNIKNKIKILDMDDMLSIRYKRQLESKGEIINPFGVYSKKLPRFMGNILNNNLVKKSILKYEQNLLSNYEVDISQKYDAVILVSDKERDCLKEKIGHNKVFTVSTGVNCNYFSDKTVNKDENVISFLGVYSAPHNEDAVLYFYKEIFPFIRESNHDIKLRLVGGNVTEKIQQLKEDKSVDVVGKVDDVRDYIKSSNVFVAPLRFGSGIKTKILEAMAMEVPVVTTSIGAEGMKVENYKDIIVEDDPKRFAEAVCKLISDPQLHEKIAKNAKEYVLNNYDWDIQMKAWKEVFDYVNEKDDILCK